MEHFTRKQECQHEEQKWKDLLIALAEAIVFLVLGLGKSLLMG